MIAQLATIPPIVHALVQATIFVYFLASLFRHHGAVAKIFFAIACVNMAIFVYHDLYGYPPFP